LPADDVDRCFSQIGIFQHKQMSVDEGSGFARDGGDNPAANGTQLLFDTGQAALETADFLFDR
jgi:hypothetical protein